VAEEFIISFSRISSAEANQYASDLAMTLRTLQKGVVFEQRRDRQDSQKPKPNSFGSGQFEILILSGDVASIRRFL
jgi:hypothetical protein